MDRYMYREYTILLDERILARLGNFHFLLHIHKKHNHINAYHVFGVVARKKSVFYANINTKYFFGTPDICFDLIFDT